SSLASFAWPTSTRTIASHRRGSPTPRSPMPAKALSSGRAAKAGCCASSTSWRRSDGETMIRTILIFFSATFSLFATHAATERVRDLGTFQSVRANQLTGYGIVVGLDGSGDDNFAYLTQAMRGVSGRFGLQLPPGVNPALKNAAAVLITAELPAFAKP